MGVDELCRSRCFTPTIRSWGFRQSQDGGNEEVRHRKGLGLGKLFWELGTLSPAPSKKDAESTGVPFPGGSTSPPTPSPARVGAVAA